MAQKHESTSVCLISRLQGDTHEPLAKLLLCRIKDTVPHREENCITFELLSETVVSSGDDGEARLKEWTDKIEAWEKRHVSEEKIPNPYIPTVKHKFSAVGMDLSLDWLAFSFDNGLSAAETQ